MNRKIELDAPNVKKLEKDILITILIPLHRKMSRTILYKIVN